MASCHVAGHRDLKPCMHSVHRSVDQEGTSDSEWASDHERSSDREGAYDPVRDSDREEGSDLEGANDPESTVSRSTHDRGATTRESVDRSGSPDVSHSVNTRERLKATVNTEHSAPSDPVIDVKPETRDPLTKLISTVQLVTINNPASDVIIDSGPSVIINNTAKFNNNPGDIGTSSESNMDIGRVGKMFEARANCVQPKSWQLPGRDTSAEKPSSEINLIRVASDNDIESGCSEDVINCDQVLSAAILTNSMTDNSRDISKDSVSSDENAPGTEENRQVESPIPARILTLADECQTGDVGTCERNDRRTEISYPQVCRLHHVMFDDICISSSPRHPHFPTIRVRMQELVQTVRSKLSEIGVPVRDIRLNGGAASYVLGTDEDPVYNDFDLIFGVDLGTEENGSERVKHAVLMSLQEFIPSCGDGARCEKPNLGLIEEVYVHKMVRVSNDIDRWSLMSLSNARGFDVELKFVDRMKRQFEFSVDSFQIILDNLLTFYRHVQPISKDCYPRVYAESVYGAFDVALDHLNRKLIATDAPEQIRGGGLLKYCHLIARGYMPANDFRTTEKYMCSRFFIDFSDVERQRAKLESYLENHFCDHRGARHSKSSGEQVKYDFLTTLHAVVEESTVCLMGQERMQTLYLIHTLASRTLAGLKSSARYSEYSGPSSQLPPRFCTQFWRREPGKSRAATNGCCPVYFEGRPHHSQYYQAYPYVADFGGAGSRLITSMMPYSLNFMPQYYVMSS